MPLRIVCIVALAISALVAVTGCYTYTRIQASSVPQDITNRRIISERLVAVLDQVAFQQGFVRKRIPDFVDNKVSTVFRSYEKRRTILIQTEIISMIVFHKHDEALPQISISSSSSDSEIDRLSKKIVERLEKDFPGTKFKITVMLEFTFV